MNGTALHNAAFGSTGETVTLVGLGGEGILRTSGYGDRAAQVIRTALDEGLAYFDSARVYRDSELYYGSVWGREPEKRGTVFQTSKSAGRNPVPLSRDEREEIMALFRPHADVMAFYR